ncbi:acyl-CoA dehydrogenase [Actinocrispum sp. NPDC049592]|uniref:acyl-CoA dehydrogenase family protein n=1 Tax=Actinocrispum sp. NPDC049592 TaxID=3154835 RepID=UPI00342D50D9
MTVEALSELVHGPVPREFRDQLKRIFAHELFAPHEGLTYQEKVRLTYDQLKLANSQIRPEELTEDPYTLFALLEWGAVISPSLFIAMVTHYGGALAAVRELGAGRDDVGDFVRDLQTMTATGVLLITEIGYGNSHVHLRTRATLDDGEFVLHTPDPAARKFMPNVGLPDVPKLATVAAQLNIGGHDQGVFLFLVPLQGTNGVKIDQLPEASMVPMDYAVIEFDHCRIPLRNLLRDNAALGEDGVFHDPLVNPEKRLVRSLTVAQSVRTGQAAALAAVSRAAVQITIRYNQKRAAMDRREPWGMVLRHRSQQRALHSALATAYALTCHANRAKQARVTTMQHKAAGQTPPPSSLDPQYRTLSLTKAIAVWTAERMMAECRQRCGARGLFVANRLLEYQGLAIVSNAAGGDNLLLCLDAAKAMVGGIAYQPPDGEVISKDLLDEKMWLGVLHSRERVMHTELAMRIRRATDWDATPTDAWNDNIHQARDFVAGYGGRLVLESMLDALHDLPEPAAAALSPLCAMFAVEEIERSAAWLLCEGLVDAEQVRSIPDVLNTLCDRITPHVPALVDAFGIPEELLRVPISSGDHAMIDSMGDPIELALPEPRADERALVSQA